MEIDLPAKRPQTALEAYELTAGCYDEFTAHHDYELWLGNLLAELRQRGLRGRRLLDVACGTGKSFLPMLDRGWRVTAVDISPAMLEHARSKAGGAARIERHDMRSLPRLGSYDLVWCLDDAVNYLLTIEELERCLLGLARNLAPEGLCLFDVNTLRSYREFFAEQHLVETGAGLLSWHGQATSETAPGSIVEAVLEIDRAGSGTERALHRQRHFLAEEIEAALSTAGLRHLASFGHGHDARLEQPLDERHHTKAIYVARRMRR